MGVLQAREPPKKVNKLFNHSNASMLASLQSPSRSPSYRLTLATPVSAPLSAPLFRVDFMQDKICVTTQNGFSQMERRPAAHKSAQGNACAGDCHVAEIDPHIFRQ